MIAHLKGREKALEEQFGLKPADAEWVALAALHSGVFLRAQFLRFTGDRRPGARVRAQRLVERLAELGVAADHRVRGLGLLCRIFARRLYRALKAENIRHRRTATPPHVLRRLLSLDFVLDEAGQPWLPTEAEKVGAFESLGIERSLFPARVYYRRGRPGGTAKRKGSGPRLVRPFAWKMPVAVRGGDSPYARFVFVDTVEASTFCELDRWGAEHARLWRALRERGIRVEAVAVSPDPERVEGLGRGLRCWVAREATPIVPAITPQLLDELQAAEAALGGLDDLAMGRWGGFEGTLERVAELQGLRRAAPAVRNAKLAPKLDSADARLVRTPALRARQ